MSFYGSSNTVPHAEAQARAADGVAIYWRPGCTFCLALRLRVGRLAARAAWVNIWDDPAGAAYVRGVNDGNETVPTVVIDGVAHTNPGPRVVRRALTRLG